MGTIDVVKVLKIEPAVSESHLRTFKTSQVPINHEMHEQVHTIIYYILNKITKLICFHGNFRIVLYNLFMYSPLTNRKRDILLSI